MGTGTRAGFCLVAATAAAVLGAAPVARAGADGASPFTAVATAQANRVTSVVPGFLALETLADGGAPVTQAQLTEAGGLAFASTLYPGETATHLEQLSGAAGLPPPPAYPLYVEAAHPDRPKAEAAPPGQQMAAEAGSDFARGSASLGVLPSATGDRPAIAASLATSRVLTTPDGSVVARAESVVEGASFPGNLRIARIDSVALATLAPGASAPTVTTTTTVTGASVGGTAVEIGKDGITRPQPGGLPAGTLAPAEQSLAKAGISVRRISGAAVAGGGSADVIEIRFTTASPATGVPGQTLRYELGGASAGVVGGGLRLGPALQAPIIGTSPKSSVPPSGSAAPVPTLSAAAGGSAAFGQPGLVSPTSAGREPAAPLTPQSFAVGSAPVGAIHPAADVRTRLGLLNLVVVLGALAAFACSSVFRSKGVRATWTS